MSKSGALCRNGGKGRLTGREKIQREGALMQGKSNNEVEEAILGGKKLWGNHLP